MNIKETVVALVNIIGAILTLTGPVGVAIGLSMILILNVVILINSLKDICDKKDTPPSTDEE